MVHEKETRRRHEAGEGGKMELRMKGRQKSGRWRLNENLGDCSDANRRVDRFLAERSCDSEFLTLSNRQSNLLCATINVCLFFNLEKVAVGVLY